MNKRKRRELLALKQHAQDDEQGDGEADDGKEHEEFYDDAQPLGGGQLCMGQDW